MVLPSQDGRPVARYSHMYRRTRYRSIRRTVVVLAVVGLAWATWAIWPSGDDADSNGQDSDQVAANDGGQPGQDGAIGLPADAFELNERNSEGAAKTAALGRDSATIDLEQKLQLQTESPRQEENGAARITMGDPDPINVGEQNRPKATGGNAGATPPAAIGSGQATPSKRYRDPLPAQRNRARQRMRTGLDLIANDRLVEARLTLTQALDSGGLDSVEEDRVRSELTEVNRRLIFSPTIYANDPYAAEHRIKPGQALSKVVGQLGLKLDYRLLVRINGLADANKIRAGDRIKVLTGPFHCVVYKSEHRMDLYMGQGSQRVFVTSFAVGLGKDDGTPIGRFMVKRDSKLINPAWTNPKTYEHYERNDPANPIGEYWIGLEGIDDSTRDLRSYGIHGTIEPESIGGNASMGCIRMHAEDVEIVFEMLVPNASVIHIRESRGTG